MWFSKLKVVQKFSFLKKGKIKLDILKTLILKILALNQTLRDGFLSGKDQDSRRDSKNSREPKEMLKLIQMLQKVLAKLLLMLQSNQKEIKKEERSDKLN